MRKFRVTYLIPPLKNSKTACRPPPGDRPLFAPSPPKYFCRAAEKFFPFLVKNNGNFFPYPNRPTRLLLASQQKRTAGGRFFQLVDKHSPYDKQFIYAGGARGGEARLESDQMSRKALPCKACVERSDYFRAARRHKNNDIISGCRKKPEAFSTA